MFCPKCGSELPVGAAFCRSCGTKVPSGRTGAPTGSAAVGTATAQTAGAVGKTASAFAAALASVAAAALSLPKAALAAIIAVVVIAGGAGVVTVAAPHGDIPNGVYSADYGSTSIGQGGTIEIQGDKMSIRNIAGSTYYTDPSPYRVSGNKLYYSPTEDDYFWIHRFYTGTGDGRIVFDYRKSGNDIVLDGVVYHKR